MGDAGMTAADTLLSRLDSPRANGPNRWRAACPVCGERNRSTLSVGVGDSGAVLLKCFKSGCGPDQIAAAIGLGIEDLFPPRDSQSSPLQRRRLITAGQALDLLHDEAQLVALAAANLAHGVELTADDRARCLTAAGRIAYLRDEVCA
jgi:hypothetical protein